MPDRLALVAHYVIARCSAKELGATKLNKVLWFADCEMYRKTGRTITGDRYYLRKEHGPCAAKLEDVLKALQSDGLIHEERVPAGDKLRREMFSLDKPETSDLTPEELAILDKISTEVCRMTAEEASDASHDDLWRETKPGALMDVAAGAVAVQSLPQDRLQWAKDAFG